MRAPLLLLVAVSLGLAACAEREQIADGKRAYQGKPDTQPWQNAPLSHEHTKWTQGDRASWEAGIKVRQMTQHEYKRIDR